MAAIALASELAHDAGMAPQIAAGFLVPADAPVDCLVTDAKRAALLEYAGDLLGAPFSTQQARHFCHVGGTETRPSPTSPTTGDGVAVRFLRPVLTVVVGGVAPQLAGNCAAVTPQQAGDLGRRAATHPLGG